MSPDFWIVTPVYNEEESVGKVFDEWIPVFRSTVKNFTWIAINDGSRDSTLGILQDYSKKYPEIEVVDKPNSGHGPSCLVGYQKAIQAGAQKVFQIDSDGQCDPQFFQSFFQAMDKHEVVMGYRRTRDDGKKRWWISRIVSVVVYLTYGIWLRDANVPYRIMSTESLRRILGEISPDFQLANIFVSAKLKKGHRIHWIPIHFRNRFGGSPSVKALTFAKHGLRLITQLREAKRNS